MKKIVSILLCSCLILSLFGCSPKSEDKQKEKDTVTEASNEADSKKDIDFPKDTITAIVPFGVGGTADLLTRGVAGQGEKYFGKPMVVTNVLGAGGAVALTEYLKEKANTHKIQMVGINQFALAPFVKEVAYKWEDFEPVIGLIEQQFVLLANPKTSKIKSLEDLIEYGKENTIKYGSDGPGTLTYLLQLELFKQAGVDAKTIVYNGAVESMNQLLGGHIDVAVTEVSLAKEHVKNGDLVPLTIFNNKPFTGYENVEDVPAVTDLGYDVVATGDLFFVTRAGTDPEVIQKLHDGIAEIYKDEDFIKFISGMGKEPNPIDNKEIKEKVNKQIEAIKTFLE